jgi:hypothetical protein
MNETGSAFLDEKVQEKKEKKVLWRGSIGFDFLFVKDYDEKGKLVKKPVCIEINSSHSGIKGIQNIPEGRIDYLARERARRRSEYHPEYLRRMKLQEEIAERMQINGEYLSPDVLRHLEFGLAESLELDKFLREYIKGKIINGDLFAHANRNPDIVHQICNNKNLQTEILGEFAPRVFKIGDDPKSRSGFWVEKPANGSLGEGIQILSDDELMLSLTIREMLNKGQGSAWSQLIKNLHVNTRFGSNTKIEEFLYPLPADRSEGDQVKCPASMRLLLDFSVVESNGKVEVLVEEGHAYQRISKSYQEELGPMVKPDPLVYIVNTTHGAFAQSASLEEKKLALPVALEIIKRLTLAQPDMVGKLPKMKEKKPKTRKK